MKNLDKLRLLFLLLILSFNNLHAQHWITTEALTTGPCISPTMATGMDGHIYAAYQDASTGPITLKENSGNAWLSVSTSSFQSGGIISMAITGIDKYYVLFKDPNAAGKLSMALYTSGTWSLVGTPGFSSATFQNPVMSVDVVTGLIYVAYYDPANPLSIEIKKLAGNTWTIIDHPAFSVDSGAPNIGFAAKNNNLFCAYSIYEGFPPQQPYGDYLYISSFSNGNWTTQRGPSSIYATNYFLPKLITDNATDNLYISYLTSSTSQPTTLNTATMSFSGSYTGNSSIPGSVGSYPVSVHNSKLYQPDELSQNGTRTISVYSLSDTAMFLGDPNFEINSDLVGMTVSSSKAMVYSFQSQNIVCQYLPWSLPSATSVKGLTPDGSYGPGKTVDIEIIANGAVYVTGNPILQLNTGNTSAGQALYLRGSGTDTLVFRYSVRTGDNNAHLDYISASALALNGGALTDFDGDPINTTLPAPGSPSSLSGQSNITVDGVAPFISTLTLPANGSYKAGAVLQFVAIYSENVIVNSGSPVIKLQVGANFRSASYVSGSGTNQLVFSYTVQTGENGQFSIDTAITLNSATIKDQAGNMASNTLPAAPSAIFADNQNPYFNITTSATGPFFANIPYTFYFTASEPITGFSLSGLNVTNAQVSNFAATSAANYSATITPTNTGTTSISVKGATAFDLAGNPNDPSATVSLQVSDVGVFKSIAPNPVGTTMNVLFTGAPDGEMCRAVLTKTTTGQVVLDRNGTITANTAHFDVTGIAAGNYICTIYWPYNSTNKTSINVHLQGY